MNHNVILLGCSHLPKVVKKKGILNDNLCEILVCSECRDDSDLSNFQEEKLQ